MENIRYIFDLNILEYIYLKFLPAEYILCTDFVCFIHLFFLILIFFVLGICGLVGTGLISTSLISIDDKYLDCIKRNHTEKDSIYILISSCLMMCIVFFFFFMYAPYFIVSHTVGVHNKIDKKEYQWHIEDRYNSIKDKLNYNEYMAYGDCTEKEIYNNNYYKSGAALLYCLKTNLNKY